MKPVLLLIPGMLNTALVWAQVVPLLEAVADIRIANVQTQSSIAQMASDALALVADVPPEQPLVVCGFSMGGFVAIEILAAGKRRVGAICLLGTSGRPESAEGSALREKTIAAIERDFDKVTAGVARYATSAQTQTNEMLMADMVALMRAVGPASAIAQNRAIMARSDHRAALAQLNLPTLVLCGQDDQITPPALSDELAALIPGAQLEWVQGAGHMVPMEQPKALANHLKNLISRISST